MRSFHEQGAAEPRPTGVFHGWSWPARIAVGVVVLLVGALLISYTMYREWPWTAYPSTLKACGRDFQKQDSPQTREQLEAGHDAKVVRIGDVPGWFNRGDLWAYANEQPFSGNCRVVMMVRDGDHFQIYDLIGGP